MVSLSLLSVLKGPSTLSIQKHSPPLDEAIDAIKAQPGITGLILNSDKSAFIVGADIKEFLGLFAKPAEELITG